MPSLSYSELVGLMIAGALVLYPLTQTEHVSGPARMRSAAVISSPSAGETQAQFMCPRSGDGL